MFYTHISSTSIYAEHNTMLVFSLQHVCDLCCLSTVSFSGGSGGPPVHKQQGSAQLNRAQQPEYSKMGLPSQMEMAQKPSSGGTQEASLSDGRTTAGGWTLSSVSSKLSLLTLFVWLRPATHHRKLISAICINHPKVMTTCEGGNVARRAELPTSAQSDLHNLLIM